MDDTSSDRLMKTSFGRLRPKPLLTVAKRTQEQWWEKGTNAMISDGRSVVELTHPTTVLSIYIAPDPRTRLSSSTARWPRLYLRGYKLRHQSSDRSQNSWFLSLYQPTLVDWIKSVISINPSPGLDSLLNYFDLKARTRSGYSLPLTKTHKAPLDYIISPLESVHNRQIIIPKSLLLFFFSFWLLTRESARKSENKRWS